MIWSWCALPLALIVGFPWFSQARAATLPPLAATIPAAGQVVVADAQLQAAGWPAAFNRAHVALTRQGKTLPLTDTGDGFAWVAPQAGTAWLSLGDTPAPRQTLPARLPTPLTWSPAALYDRHAQTASGRSWWAGELRGDAPLSATLMLDTALPAGTPVQIQLRATAAGSHAVAVALDGQALPTLRWSDATPQVVTHTLMLGAHAAGPLRLDLAQAVAGDTVRVAAITLPTVFPLAPALPAPALRHAVTVPADAAQADLLMLAHADFLPALGPLVAAHAQRGERAVAVDVQAAYDADGFGDPSPEAIRTLIRALQPRAVLLVGAGSVATGAAAAARPTFIPPYLVVLPFDGETACDSCYGRLAVGDVRGQVVPDIPVGRLPVRTRAEAEAVVAKTVAAITAAPAGSWQTRALVVADNDLAADGTPDPAGPFSATVAAGLAALPRGVAATTLAYAPDQAQASGMWEPDVARLRCRMFRAMDGGRASDTACAPNTADARGVALWVYVGHGSPWQWGATEPTAATPYLWYLYDADARRNGAQLPILLGMTCLSGDFANPVLETTDERLVLRASGGVLASLSSTGEGVNTGHQALLPAVVGQLYAPSGDRSLGAALLAGLRALGVAHADQAYTFGILGDPLVGVPWVPQGTAYLPLVTR